MLEEKAFLIRLTDDMHKAIKISATVRNMSMTDWVLQAIAEKLNEEAKYGKSND